MQISCLLVVTFSNDDLLLFTKPYPYAYPYPYQKSKLMAMNNKEKCVHIMHAFRDVATTEHTH